MSNKISKFQTSAWLLSEVHDGPRLQPYHYVWLILCHFFLKIRILFFNLIMNQTSKPPCATKFGAPFRLNKLLLQRTNEWVFQLSCLVNWSHFSSTKACPLELISSSSSLSASSSIRSSLLFLEDQYSRRLENNVVLGATAISFFQECRLVWWTWIFLLLLPVVVEDTFGCRKIKFTNVSASDISPMSGTCVNLLASITMLLFLAVVEFQSWLNGRHKWYHKWS